MFSGMPTRIFTALVVGMQILSTLFLTITLPESQSLAYEPKTLFQMEVSDIMHSEELAAPVEGAVANEVDALPAEEGAYDEVAMQGDAGDYWNVPEGCESAYATLPCAAGEGVGAYSADELRSQGVINDGSCRYTWYSQRVLPGGGLNIEGRHVSVEGYVMDASERIVVASSDMAPGTEIDVPFGTGKAIVLDTGCASGVVDIYTDF